MAVAERRADVVWEGGLADGNGHVTSGTGALGDLPVSWPARTERPDGKTSPEELIAAAHAACYAMALSHVLGEQGTKPERLAVSATVTFDPAKGAITSSRLEVRGRVPGIDQARFEEAARQGEQGCPVSNALRGNLEIELDARLEDS